MRLVVVFTCFALLAIAQPDPRDIVRKSVALDKANAERARNYAWTQHTIQKERDAAGKVEKTESRTEEMVVVGGEPYRRLVARNDQPLSEAERKREQARQEKVAADRTRLTEVEKAKRRERQRAFLQEIPEAYNFTLLPDEAVDGRPMWVMEATPRPGYKFRALRANLLSKFKGKLWIDKTDYLWVRVDCESIEPVSFGLFLAKLNKGAHIYFEQTRVNGEVWLPTRTLVQVDARLLISHKRAEIEQTTSNYKKFQVESTTHPMTAK